MYCNPAQRNWKTRTRSPQDKYNHTQTLCEIAEHITDIRKQAQQLKDKTKEELKKASEEIEKILLT